MTARPGVGCAASTRTPARPASSSHSTLACSICSATATTRTIDPTSRWRRAEPASGGYQDSDEAAQVGRALESVDRAHDRLDPRWIQDRRRVAPEFFAGLLPRERIGRRALVRSRAHGVTPAAALDDDLRGPEAGYVVRRPSVGT